MLIILTMGLFSWIFADQSKADESPKAKAIGTDSRELTTGREEIVMSMPQIAFMPPAGWSPFTGVKKEQRPADVRVANPSLLGRAGMVTCLLFPNDGQSVTDRIDKLLSRMRDQVVERSSKTSPSGVEITFLHTVGAVPGKEIKAHTMHCFFTNHSGEVVDLYCTGRTEEDARLTSDSFLRTLRLIGSDAPPERK